MRQDLKETGTSGEKAQERYADREDCVFSTAQPRTKDMCIFSGQAKASYPS